MTERERERERGGLYRCVCIKVFFGVVGVIDWDWRVRWGNYRGLMKKFSRTARILLLQVFIIFSFCPRFMLQIYR